MGPAKVLSTLEPALSAEVLAVAVRASTRDGVRPLSEQTVLDLRRLPVEGDALDGLHVVLLADDGDIGTTGPAPKVLAYAHVSPGEAPSAELVVDRDHRRVGHGRALLGQLLEQWPAVRVWAHGDLPGAQALASRLDLRPVRDLWSMSRPLTGEWSELPEVTLPEGFTVRAFQMGRDEQAWLDVNRRSFASHPEQAHVTLADLRERMAEPWFDPAGFLVVEDQRTTPPTMAAFHWTKVERAEPGSTRQTSGEVYVLGVDPAYQGQGLGTVTTVLGLAHLRTMGLGSATLYVDGDNAAAIATYHRLGFERSAVDVMYAAGDPSA